MTGNGLRSVATMRLKSEVWVFSLCAACCFVEGIFAVVRRRGAAEAKAIFIKANRLDATADVYGPTSQTARP